MNAPGGGGVMTRIRNRGWPWLIGALVLGLVLLPFAFVVPDLPAADLRAKYAGPASEFLPLAPGLSVHVRDQGPRDGLPIVLVHGSNAALQDWEPWVARLSDKYRVITLDLPGHGLTGPNPSHDYSAAAFGKVIAELAAAKGLTRFVIGGNSMGGGVAWSYAAAHPDQVAGVILVDASGQPDANPSGPPLLFKLAQTPGVRNLLEHMAPEGMLESTLKASYGDPALVTPALVERYRDLLRYPGNRHATIERFAGPPTVASDAELAKLKMPVLILWGSKDQLIPVSSAAWFSKRLPGARVIVYDGVGHLPMEEAADRSAADARAFLDGLDQTPAVGRVEAR